MIKDYISITYSKTRAPQSKYPAQLITYLVNRFDIKPGEKLLEIGCGRSDFLLKFSDYGLICSGIDKEKSALEFSKKVDVKICDISSEKLPYADNSYDVVYHKSLIEHLYNPDNLMKESYRVLKQGGKLIILTPDWKSQYKNFYEDITHCRPYDINALRDTYLIYGFNNIQVERFYQLPVIWKYKILKLLSGFLQILLSTHSARKITDVTKVKFFRWSVELMVLGYGEK